MRIDEYVAAVPRGASPHGGCRGRAPRPTWLPGVRCVRKRSRRLPLARCADAGLPDTLVGTA
ncbi:hypothetical protein GZL_07928 [Streptomyces sp. 769]|nr:hypothetical protein GZL_07928 [Streptomyces sp. 769]